MKNFFVFKWVVPFALFLYSGIVVSQPTNVDIQVQIGTSPGTFTPGNSDTSAYSFTVSKSNSTAADVSNVGVSSSFLIGANPANVTGVTWTCTVPTGTSNCDTATGSGNINATVDLNGADGVLFTITNVTYGSDIFSNLTFKATMTNDGVNNNDLTSSNDTASASITRASVTDIGATVSDSSSTYTPGATGVTYTATISNSGPSDAQAVAFSDTVPSGMTINSWTCSADTGSSCSSAGASNANVNPSLDLESGDSATISVNVSYASSATANPLLYAISASVTDANASDSTPAAASDSDTRNPVSNLSVSVDTSVSATTQYTPGATETYIVVVSNSGPSDVSGVTIADNNLSEYSSFSWTCSADSGSACGAASGSTRLNSTADIDSGDSVTYTVNVTYKSGTTTSPLVYQVTATNPMGAGGTSPVSDNKSLTINRISNLQVTLTDSATTYTPGLSGAFVAVVTNTGPSDVIGAEITDSDPSEFGTISWTCSVVNTNSACTDASGTAAIDTTVNLVKNDSATFTINAGFASSAVTNPLVYSVTATNPAGISGTSPATATDNDDVLDRQVNLSITKTGKSGTLVPNEPFTYTITITNAGPSDLGAALNENGLPTEQGVILTDSLDTTLLNHPTECSGDDDFPCWEYCAGDDGVINSALTPDDCPANSEVATDSGTSISVPIRLSKGSSTEVWVHTRVSESTGSDCDPGVAATNEVCNSASIAIPAGEATTTRNIGTDPLTDSTSNEIVIGTDLIVTKTDNKTSAAPGTQNTYTVTVRNDGYTNVQGIAVQDLMPVYPTDSAGYLSGSISWYCETSDAGACCNTQSTACGLTAPTDTVTNDNLNAVIDLDSQTEVSFTITGDLSADASGTVSNSATATLPAGVVESDPSNNTGTDTTTLGSVSDIAVSKSLELVSINPQDQNVTDLKYKIRVQNLGPSVDSSVTVSDLLDDSNLDINTASWTCSITGSGSCTNAGPVTASALSTTVSLQVGAIAEFIVNISTNSAAQGKVVNTVTATSSSFDPVSINNSASVEYSLTGNTHLSISNDDAKLTSTPGLSTNYTIRVSNEGPDDMFGANVVNNFSPKLTDIEWSCSAVSPIPGDLTLLQRSDQSAAGTILLKSPDDSHLYITSPTSSGTDSKLYVFKRNTLVGSTFGEIIFVEFVTQGVNGVEGIENPVAMAISSSGADLYVLSNIASGSSNVPAIAIFKRNTNSLAPDFGKLTFQGTMETNIPASPQDILLSQDQKHIYVSGDGELQRYSRDAGSGLLTHEDTSTHSDAGKLAQSSAGSEIYIADASGDMVSAFSRETDDTDPAFGDLTSLNDIQNSDVSNVTDIIVSNDNKNIYLAANGNGRLILLNRDLNTGGISFAQSYNDTNLLFNPSETLVGLKSLSIAPDGGHLFIANPAANAVLVLSRNSQGLLSKKEKISIPGLEGVNDVDITSDGKHVVTTSSATGGKTLIAFARRQPDPVFSFVEAEYDGIDDTSDSGGVVDGLLGSSAVAVTSDGEFVYSAGLGEDSLAVFKRDKTKGSTAATRPEHLIFVDSYKQGDSGISGLVDVNSISITPNGNYLYAGSTDQGSIAVFSRASDGTLQFVDSYFHSNGVIDGLLGVSSMAVDSSNQHLYVAGKFEASVAHYGILADGRLNLIDAVSNGDAGVSGLAGATSVAISPDAEHVIVASSIDDSVVVLDRTPLDGSISFQQQLINVGDQPLDLSISPDGEHVYVVAANDSRLTVLNRVANAGNVNFGQLTVAEFYTDGVGGYNYLHGVRTVASSKDGKKVYVGAEFDNAISILNRDYNPNSSSFGLLSIAEVSIDDVDGVDGIGQIYDLVVSNDSKNVYAAGFADDAVSSFVLGSGSFCSAQGTGNIDDQVDIGSNGTLTYTVSAKIRPGATGELVTEARILPPDNFTLLNPDDNCSTSAVTTNDSCDKDSTQLIPVTDLSISKTDNRLSVIAGEPLQYKIVVTNNGPSDARSTNDEIIKVVDTLTSQYDPASVNWTCEATGSGSLSFVDSVADGESGITGLQGVSSLAVAENLAGLGKHVIATSVLDNGLLVFSVNDLTGELTQVLDGGTYIQAGAGVNLQGARDVLVIDNDIYVASQIDDSLVAFRASDNSGLDIQFQQNHNFSTGVFGLNQAVTLTASADGKNIYVGGSNDNSLVVFNRNLTTGVLTHQSTLTEGSGGNQGLSGINSVAVSTDGLSVYTGGANNATLGYYKRSTVDGSLTFVAALNSSSTTADLNGISALKVSDDDKEVYVSSSLNNSVYVFGREISVPPADSAYGTLTLKQTVSQNVDGVVGLLSPSDITTSGDDRHVYVSNEQSDSVVWFVRNLQSGNLTFAGVLSNSVANVSGMDGAISVITDAGGEYVYVAGSQDHAVVVLKRKDDSYCPSGGTGNLAAVVDLAVNGSLEFNLNATVASDATGILSNEAGVFSCFTPEPAMLEGCPGSDLAEANNTDVDTTSINPTADLAITKSDGISQYDGLLGAVKVTGDADHLYVAAKGENSIGIFERESNNGDADFGQLIYSNNVTNGVDGVSGLLAVSDVVLSSDGMTLYAAGTGDNSVVVFRRNLFDGSLTILEKHSSGVFGVSGIEGIESLAISPDGSHLYASGPLTNSLAVFAIDQNVGSDLGKLTFKQQLQNGVSGVSGLASVSDIVVSSDGSHVYVSSKSDSSISVFLRNPNSASVSFGQLSYVVSYINGTDDIAGLGGVSAMAMPVSLGGEYLYALGATDQSLAVFSRDTGTGELIFIEYKQNGTGGVSGLDNAKDIVISDDESSVYVAGFGQNSIINFDRDAGDGSLTFSQILTDGDPLPQPGEVIDGLAGASGVFVSADDNHVYVAASNDNSLSAFSRDISAMPVYGDIEHLQTLKDGQGGVSPGTEVTYTIIVSNYGPSDAEKVIVTDNFPPEFEQISYECFPVNGAACDTNPQTGNVNETVDLPVGSRVEIQASGVVRSDASGTLVNTATVRSSDLPGFTILDPNPDNNSATDDDTVLSPAVDLKVIKTNNLTEVIPGTNVTYTIIVSNDAQLGGNNEPADITGVTVTDIVPEAMTKVSWTCEAFPQPGLLDDGDEDPLLDSFINYNDLDLFIDMVIDSSGYHAYVAGVSAGVDTILVYDRDKRTGELTEIQRLTNGSNNINGIAGISSLSLSQDGKNLYATGSLDDALVTFNINSSSLLSISQVQYDGISGVNGLGGAADVVISPDNKFVYVAGKLDNAVAWFSRDLATGSLTYSNFLTGVEGLSGIEAMSFSSNGNHLLAVAEANNSLASYARDLSTGSLTLADSKLDFQIAGSVLVQPRDLFVTGSYIAVAAYGSDAVSLFSLNSVSGLLTFEQVITHGDAGVSMMQGPEKLIMKDSSNELYVASGLSESITLLQLKSGILESLNIVYDTSAVSGLDGVNNILMDEEGHYLYALSDDLTLASVLNGSVCGAEKGIDQLNDVADIISGGYVEYTLQGTVLPGATGNLTNTATALVGPGFVELYSPDNTDTDTDLLTPVSDLSVNKTDGLSQVVAGTPISYTIDAYSAGPSTVNALVEDVLPVFPVDNAGIWDGSATWQCGVDKTLQLNDQYVDDSVNGLSGVSTAVYSKNGLYVYSVSSTNNSVSLFSKNISGELVFVSQVTNGDIHNSQTVSGLEGASSIVFDHEQRFAYVTGYGANAVAVFSVNDTTGQLTFVQKVQSGIDGVIGMTQPIDAVISPDNKSVYIAAKGSDAITVFSRDNATGELTFVERVRDGFGTIVPESNVIIGISDLIMSSDGAYLYTASDFSEAIAIFSRNSATHVLTFAGVIREGDVHNGIPVTSLQGLRSLVMSPNDLYLYALATEAGTLLRFSRDDLDGSLNYESQDVVTDPMAVDPAIPTQVALTPNAERLLISNAYLDSVSLYDRNIETGELNLIDVFTNVAHGSSEMVMPQSVDTDGVNVIVASPLNNALVTLRITAHADCEATANTGNTAATNIFMTPASSASMEIQALVHPSARGIINNTATISAVLPATDDNLINNSSLDTTEIIIETDVAIVKTAPEQVIAGEGITYTLVLTNTGPSDALGVNIVDTLDPAIIDASWTCTATGRSVCDESSGTGSVNTTANVTIDGTVEIVINATVSSAFHGDLDNTATAIVFEQGVNTDTDISNNESSTTTSVIMQADVEVSKTNNTNTVVAGEFVNYEIVVTNNGPSDSPNTVITDIMPPELVSVSWTCSTDINSSCSSSGTGHINDTTYIAAGSELVYLVSGLLPSSLDEGTLINSVTANVLSPATDTNTANNTAQDSDPIIQDADMQIVLTTNMNPYDPQSHVSLSYMMQIDNAGPSDARDVIVSFDSDLNYILQPNAFCNETLGVVVCDLGYSSSGDSYQIPLELSVSDAAPLSFTSTAEVSSITNDSDLNNNISSLNGELLTGIDLKVSKTDGWEFVEPGAEIQYLIVIENIGSVGSGEVVIDEQLPAELINPSWTCQAFDGASCINIDETGITGSADLPAGSRVELILNVTVDPLVSGSVGSFIINTVNVNSLDDINQSNNSASDSDEIVLYIFKNGFEELNP